MKPSIELRFGVLLTVGLLALSTLPVSASVTPNDPYWNPVEEPDLWNLKKIEADYAWDLDLNNEYTNIGSNSIIVAVMDSGINWDHEDLSPDLMWENPNDHGGDGNMDGSPGVKLVDDDGDGLIDEDQYGVEQWARDEVTGEILFEGGLPVPTEEDWDENARYDNDENGYYQDRYGWNFFTSASATHGGTWNDILDLGWWKAGGSESKVILENHGTRVASYIGATLNNNIGITGITPNVKIMTLKIADRDNQWFNPEVDNYHYAESIFPKAIQYAIDNGADIISLPGWFDPDDPFWEDLIDMMDIRIHNAYESGICLFAPSGDTGDDEVILYPGCNEHVVAIGSIDVYDHKAWYSPANPEPSFPPPPDPPEWNNQVELVAPSGDTGVDGEEEEPWERIALCNDLNEGTEYHEWMDVEEDYTNDDHPRGSEFACAEVVATAAMMLSYDPSLSPGEVRRLLHITADDVIYPDGTPTPRYGFDRWSGYGCVNVEAALRTAVSIKPEFIVGGNYFDNSVYDGPIIQDGGSPPSGFEPAFDIDTMGYYHVVSIQKHGMVQEIVYCRLNAAMEVIVQSVRIETLFNDIWHDHENSDSYDPAISVDIGNQINIVWRESFNSIYYVRLNFNCQLQAWRHIFQYASTISDLNLESSRDGTHHFLIYHYLWAGQQNTIVVNKIDNAGQIVTSRSLADNWPRDPDDYKEYTRPSVDICRAEGNLEDIVIVYECDHYQTPNHRKGIGIWIIRDNPPTLDDVLQPSWVTPNTVSLKYLDPDVDVDYTSRKIVSVFRILPAAAQNPYPDPIGYVLMDGTLIQGTSQATLLTYTRNVVDVTFGGGAHFNPQVSINWVRNHLSAVKFYEVRVVYESYDYVMSFSLMLDGRTLQPNDDVVGDPGGPSNLYSKQILPGTPIGYECTYPQISSTDRFPTPVVLDGSFHMMHFIDWLSPLSSELRFYTTRLHGEFDLATGLRKISTIQDVGGISDPDLTTDAFGGRHIVWSEDLMFFEQVFYSYIDPSGQLRIDARQVTTTDSDKEDPKISVSIAVDNRDPEDVDLYNDMLVVHIIWWDFISEPLGELYYSQLEFDPDNPSTVLMNIDEEEVHGTYNMEDGFFYPDIVSYTDYSLHSVYRYGVTLYEYSEFIYLTWSNMDGDLYFQTSTWHNIMVQQTVIDTDSWTPDMAVDSCGNAYIIYERFDDIYIQKMIYNPGDYSFSKLFTGNPDHPQVVTYYKPGGLVASNPRVVIDREVDRIGVGVERSGRLVMNDQLKNYKNNEMRSVHIVFSANTDSVTSLPDGNVLYYAKYNTDCEELVPHRIIYPVSTNNWFYCDVPIEASIALSEDNELAVTFAEEVEVDEINGYCWGPIDQTAHLWFLLLSNNGELRSDPTFLDHDGSWDIMGCVVADATPTDMFDIVYLKETATLPKLLWTKVPFVKVDFSGL